MDFTEAPRRSSESGVPAKALVPMEVRLSGKEIEENSVPLNAARPISCRFSAKVTDFKPVFSKAWAAMARTGRSR